MDSTSQREALITLLRTLSFIMFTKGVFPKYCKVIIQSVLKLIRKFFEVRSIHFIHLLEGVS